MNDNSPPTVFDKRYMAISLEEAKNSLAKNEIPVGAVLVQNNQILAQSGNLKHAHNSVLGHAECLVIQQASQALGNWRLLNTILYVSLEPCMMCLGAILASRIQAVIIATPDKQSGLLSNHTHLLEHPFSNHRPDIIWAGEPYAEQSKALLKEFFDKKR